jgi:hydrogenase maturation protease
VQGGAKSNLEVRARFLQLVQRSIGQVKAPQKNLEPGVIPDFQLVERLDLDGKIMQPWQEAVEREIGLPACDLEALKHDVLLHQFSLPGEKQLEPVPGADGQIACIVVRQREEIRGTIQLSAQRLREDVFKICIRIQNETAFEMFEASTRDDALLRSLVSAHTVMGVQHGVFVSATDPPESVRDFVAGCTNTGAWPVLVGDEVLRDTMLCSPIILYDYPQIAPESTGDLFDGTEIDEILSLRIMTLTDEEKREVRQSDERARKLLDRTETLPAEHLMKLHGVLRGMRPLKEDTQ